MNEDTSQESVGEGTVTPPTPKSNLGPLKDKFTSSLFIQMRQGSAYQNGVDAIPPNMFCTSCKRAGPTHLGNCQRPRGYIEITDEIRKELGK